LDRKQFHANSRGDWSLEALRQKGFREELIDAVDCLTRKENETKKNVIKRVSVNPTAKTTKIAGLLNNMDPGRITKPTKRDIARFDKYRRSKIKIISSDLTRARFPG